MRTNDSTCKQMRRTIDAHFAGRGDAVAEERMREHLPGCAACHRHYERHLLLARLDPSAPSTEDRLGRSLGLRPPQRGWQRPLLAGFAAAAAAALALVVLGPSIIGSHHQPGAGFVARGSAAAASATELLVYRIEKGRPPSLLAEGQGIGRGDELAFAYRNPAQKPRLLVFGVGERRRIYWYHPAWTDPSTSPVAVAIAGGDERHELPEAIAHPIEGRRLRIVALFADRAVSVRDVEALLERQPDLTSPLPLPGAVERSLTLQIER